MHLQELDGSDVWGGKGSSNFGDPRFHVLTWVKVLAVREVLKMGYDVHFGDLDSVYFRDALK